MGLLADAVLPLRIALFVAAVPLLSRLPMRRLEACIDPSRPAHVGDTLQAERIIRLTGAVCRTVRPFIHSPCQVRGLTLYYFLRRAGVEVSLVFGIGRMNEAYAGHCWLVKDNEPYLETVDPREHFTPMYAFHSQQGGDFRGGVSQRLFR